MRIVTSAVVFFIVGYSTLPVRRNLKVPVQNSDVDDEVSHINKYYHDSSSFSGSAGITFLEISVIVSACSMRVLASSK